MWIDEEINHHHHSLTMIAEIVQNLVGRNVRFRHQKRIAGFPKEELPEFFQEIKGFMRLFLSVRPLRRNDKRRSVHTKSRNSQSKPKPHDLLDLVADRRIPCIEIGLVRINPGEIESL